MKRFLVFLIPILILLFSCSKEDDVNVHEIALGDWDVVEYAKYQEGDKVTFIKGEPYFLLERYAQGITIVKDGYYYRYGPMEEVNETNFHEKVDWSLTRDLKFITFTIPTTPSEEPVIIQAEIIRLDKASMWIKYKDERRNGGYIFEYIFQKK